MIFSHPVKVNVAPVFTIMFIYISSSDLQSAQM